ncbi:MAG: GGDEF domain-containing response regulator [Desulfocapsaceae bacterium]
MQTTGETSVILIVDDDRPVREALSVVVSSLGYTSLIAASGREAVEILKKTSCDIVLCDLIMPQMDGMTLLKHIIKHHFNTDVIIATGHNNKVRYAEVIRAGAIDFIKKPIDQAELEAKLARAIRERRLLRNLEALSMSDSLTSLLNRRAYDQRLPHEVERAHRQGYQLFLALIDVDNFKAYNDTHGHDEGDKILITLGMTLNEFTRNSVDLCFRLGGDEFAVLLPQTTAAQAKEIIQRVMYNFSENNTNHTTLSIGIVTCRRNDQFDLGGDISRMQISADQAMYDAKNSGKNCIICRL